MQSPESAPYLGERYTILGRIGAGGMGCVYLAHDRRQDRRVAVKVLGSQYSNAVGTHRFLQEIRIASVLVHPNIVALYDSGDVGGRLFYVMPYVEGETLRQVLSRETMLPVARVLEWTTEIARGLAYAHAKGFVHRDIKPENLLVCDGHILIADFGIGRVIDRALDEGLTSDQLVVGTPTYMSPEQATASRVDARSDIYSLACVTYEMLTGEPPFRGATAQSLTAKKVSRTYLSVRVVRPTVPRSMAKALDRALEPVAADRFTTPDEFVQALRPQARRGNRLARVMLACGGVLAVALGLTLALNRGQDDESASRRRVIVSPFEDRTGGAPSDPLGLMAADWVTEGLQRTGSIDVVPSLTAIAASRYVRESADTLDPIQALARETGAVLVVTGAIYRTQDTLIIQAQLADAQASRLIGVIEPLRIEEQQFSEALQQLRTRLMGLLALSLDERVIQTERPPTYAAYQAFSQGASAYVENDYAPALAAFERAFAADTTFVLSLLYASFCHTNLRDYASADSVLRIVARQRDRLSEYHKDWLDYQRAELAGDQSSALSAIRRAAQLAPSSKATYNLAVAAFEAGRPFVAESALGALSPDVGAMRGWLPYWDLLASAQHTQGKHRVELQTAEQARRRYPSRVDGYAPHARALASLRRGRELEQLWRALGQQASGTPLELGELALSVGDELRVHGDAGGASTWWRRAYQEFGTGDTRLDVRAIQWGRARAAARLGRRAEALRIGEDLAASDSTREEYRGFVGVLAAQRDQRARAEALLEELAADRRPYQLGHPQFESARVAAALGLLDRANELLVSAFSGGYPYDIAFHRDPILSVLPGHSLRRR